MSTLVTDVVVSKAASQRATTEPGSERQRLRKVFLACGVAATAYYAAINVYVPMQWEDYSVLSQAVSELSAIGAPTRRSWLLLGLPYTLLSIAFGWGVWTSSSGSRAMRSTGGLFMAQGTIGAYWPPMHLRGVDPTATDTLHLVWAAGWLLTMLAAMALAAAAMGRRFRVYTAATVSLFIVFGALTSIEATRMAAGLPTPFLGLWERINMGAAMLWVAVLAMALRRHAFLRPHGFSQ